MLLKKINNLYFPFFLVCIYLVAWTLQDELFLNWDVSLLLHITKLMLQGGKYGYDFLTPNPPMILYLYILPLITSKILPLSIIISFRMYIFLIASISLFICYRLTRKIFSPQDSLMANLFLLGIAAVFLIIPLHQFGQRDPLLVIFSMPYLLTVVCRLQGQNIKSGLAVIVGLLASVGFALKPHFLILLILVETYYLYRKKNLYFCIRAETITIFSILLIYAITTVIYYPEFFNIIVPFMKENYYKSISIPWMDVLDEPITLFSILVVSLYLLAFRDKSFSDLTDILFIATISFLLTYISQRSAFLYHKIPQFSLAILLLLVSFSLFLKKYRHIFTILCGILLFSLPINFLYHIRSFGLSYKSDHLNKIILFVNQLSVPHQSLYVLANPGNIGMPLIDYANMQCDQRIDSLWVASGLVKKSLEGEFAARTYIKNNTDKMFFLNLLIDDLNHKQPDLIFVDDSKYNFLLNGVLMHFDYLDYFLENEKFKTLWNHYSYLTTMETQFKIRVYRKSINFN